MHFSCEIFALGALIALFVPCQFNLRHGVAQLEGTQRDMAGNVDIYKEDNAEQVFAETSEAITKNRVVATQVDFKKNNRILVSGREEKVTYENGDGCFVTEDKKTRDLLACGHFAEADQIGGACVNHTKSRLICSDCLSNAVCLVCKKIYCPDCIKNGLCRKCRRSQIATSLCSSIFRFLFGEDE